MSNLHVSLDEANKHTPKGFDSAVSNTFPWKDELNQSTYREQMELPPAINFVDGTVVAPTSVDGDIYVLIGAGVVDPSWSLASIGDWVKFTNAIASFITPIAGTLCYDKAGASWMEYDGAAWAAFGVGGTDTNLATNDLTLAVASRFYNINANDLQFKDGANNRLRMNSNGVAIGDSAAPTAGKALLITGSGTTSGTSSLRAENSNGTASLDFKDDGSLNVVSNGTTDFSSPSSAALFNLRSDSSTLYTELRFQNNIGTKGFIATFGSTYSNVFHQNKIQFLATNGMITNVSTDNHYWSFGTATEANTNMKLTTSGLIIGTATGTLTPTARLQVHGNLLIKTSDGASDLFTVATTGETTINAPTGAALMNLKSNVATSYTEFRLQNDAGTRGLWLTYGSAYSTAFFQNKVVHLSTAGTINTAVTGSHYWNFGTSAEANAHMKLTTAGLLLGDNIGASTPTAILNVRGTGATSGTTAFKVENSVGTHSLHVRDDGSVGFGPTTFTGKYSFHEGGSGAWFTRNSGDDGTAAPVLAVANDGSGTIIASSGNGIKFRVRAVGASPFGGSDRMFIASSGKIGVNTLVGTAFFEVKGAGTTSATSSLLITDSAIATTFEVKDDGGVYIGTAPNTAAGTTENLVRNTSTGEIETESYPIVQAKITISNAQLLAAKTTPITLVAAQGAGTAILLHSAKLGVVPNTTVESTNPTQTMTITYPTHGNVASFTTTQVAWGTVAELIDRVHFGSGNMYNAINEALTIDADVANFVEFDGTMDVYITYEVITI